MFFPRILDINALRALGDSRSTMAKSAAKKAAKRKTAPVLRDGPAVIQAVIATCSARPAVGAAKREKKLQYAVVFADAMAKCMADDLSPFFPGITATTKREAGSAGGKKKQLDVNFSTAAWGLAVGISLKSVHIREGKDGKQGRYNHNMKRNEEELRIESIGYHRRQPYAVMVGVLFLPFDSCTDGRRGNSSSFGSWVRHLRPYGGRASPTDDLDHLEKIYIALYEPDGSDLMFFDVAGDPPKNGNPPRDGDMTAPDGRPRRLLTYREFLSAVHRVYVDRNELEFIWATGGRELESPDEVA